MIQLPETSLLYRLLFYDADTGQFVWLARPREMFQSDRIFNSWNAKLAGQIAGVASKRDGYLRIGLLGKDYLSHRLAWKMHFGTDPTGQIDHIDGVRTNNRIANLRDVTNAENQRNAKRPLNNTSGVVGVAWHAQRQKWRARITVDGVTRSLGLFQSHSDATAARKTAETFFRFHPNHGRAA